MASRLPAPLSSMCHCLGRAVKSCKNQASFFLSAGQIIIKENVQRFAKRLHQECDWQSHSWWSRLAKRWTFSCIDTTNDYQIIIQIYYICTEGRPAVRHFCQLLLIQPTTNAKGSLNCRDYNSSNDTRRCWQCIILLIVSHIRWQR